MSSYVIHDGQFQSVHFGNIYQYYADGQLVDDDYEFDEYIERARAELTEQSARHVALDLEPLVLTVDHELRAVEHTQTPLVEAFVRNQHMVLLGGAGTGKTSSVRYLASRGEGDLRILVELARFRRLDNTSDVNALLMLVGEQIMALGRKTSAPSVRLLRSLLEKEPVTLFFDGLNEVEASIRPFCLKAVDDLRTQFPCRVVLSTRDHGFVPPTGWSIFRLREMSDSQIIDYLRRNAEPHVAAIISRHLAVDDNPLLRVPLFLKYVIDLVSEEPDAETALTGSRATIVSRYVRFLCKRDDAKLNPVKLDGELLREMLARLALTLQTVGQSLSRKEAVALVADLFDKPVDANDAFDRIAARGLLIADDRHVRFWHHTIQEYFYASGRRDELFRGGAFRHRAAQKLFSKLSDEDALTFAVAEASDEELNAMMPTAIRANPLLAIRWADDLVADGRGGRAVQMLIETMRTKLRNTSRYSQLTYERNGRQLGLTVALLGSLFFGALVVASAFDFAVFPVVVVALFGFILLVVIGALFFYPGCDYAASIGGAIRGIRSRSLREPLTELFQSVRQSRWSRMELVRIAESALFEPSTGDDPLTLVEKSTAPFVAIRILGSSNDPRAPHALEALVRSGGGNVYSRQALRTLSERGRRNPGEHEAAMRLARELLSRNDLHLAVKKRIAEMVGVAQSGLPPFAMAKHWLVQTLIFVGLQAFWAVLILLMIVKTDRLWVILLLAAPIGVGFGIYRHARRIGAKRIVGYISPESAGPLEFAFLGAIGGLVTLVAVPIRFYVWHLPFIRLDARGPDFATARAIFEQLKSGERADTQ
jgi:hypothetical protein